MYKYNYICMHQQLLHCVVVAIMGVCLFACGCLSGGMIMCVLLLQRLVHIYLHVYLYA